MVGAEQQFFFKLGYIKIMETYHQDLNTEMASNVCSVEILKYENYNDVYETLYKQLGYYGDQQPLRCVDYDNKYF